MTEPSATGGASLPASPPDQLVLDGAPAGGLWGDAWRRFRRHRLAMLGSAFFLLVVILAVGAPLAAPMDPNDQNLRQIYQPPSASHWLGTDALGRDVWSRLVYASRISMSVGILAVAIYMVIGIVLGAVSGYVGGWPDMVIQRITELVMTFPTLLIIMTIVALVGQPVQRLPGYWPAELAWRRAPRAWRVPLAARTRLVLAARCVGGVRPASFSAISCPMHWHLSSWPPPSVWPAPSSPKPASVSWGWACRLPRQAGAT